MEETNGSREGCVHVKKFEVGDKVQIKNFTEDYNGRIGVVDYIYKNGLFDYIVIIDGRTIAFLEEELEMVYETEKVVFT